MAADGTPDFATTKGGEEIARLRTLRDWSRAKLIFRLSNEMEEDASNYDSISESWLARLETGRMVKISRQTIEALCRALNCTDQERVRVLQLFDRNVLNTAGKVPAPTAELINFAMARLHDEAGDILKTLLGQRRAADLNEQEILELTAAALDMVIKNRK